MWKPDAWADRKTVKNPTFLYKSDELQVYLLLFVVRIYRSIYRKYTLGRNIFPNNFHGGLGRGEGASVAACVDERKTRLYIYIYL